MVLPENFLCDRYGLPLMGYIPWGCIDQVSVSTSEYVKRYGVIYVRRYGDSTGDFARLKEKSFYW